MTGVRRAMRRCLDLPIRALAGAACRATATSPVGRWEADDRDVRARYAIALPVVAAASLEGVNP